MSAQPLDQEIRQPAMRSPDRRRVARLIQAGQRLRLRYGIGATQVGEPGLRVLLDEHALALGAVMQRWERLAWSGPRRLLGGRLADRLIDWEAHGLRHDDHRWIAYLARREGRFLAEVERLAGVACEPCASLLRHDLPRLRGIDQDMYQLAHGGRCHSF